MATQSLADSSPELLTSAEQLALTRWRSAHALKESDMTPNVGLRNPEFHPDDLPDMLHSCHICGDEGATTFWRYWDPDYAWRLGWLCRYCADYCRTRGPQPDDYAVLVRQDRTGTDLDTILGEN